MRNKLIFLLFLLLFLIPTHKISAIFSTSTNEIFDEVIDDATETIKDEMGEYAKEKADETTQKISNTASQTITRIVKKIPNTVISTVKLIFSKAADIARGSMNENTKNWLSERKNLTIEGLREEKTEFEGDVERLLLKLWQKIKNSIKRKEKE